MSTPFSRTIRSLEADSPRLGILGLFFIVMLLGGWLTWGLLSRVTVYEVTERANLVGETRIIAQFSPTVRGRIQPGQSARLRLDSYPWLQYGTVSATVVSVHRQPRNGWLEARLAIKSVPTTAISLQHGLTGVVEVEVEQVSPAALLLRTAGLWDGGQTTVLDKADRESLLTQMR